METVKILAIDPSLRNTGLALLSYNTELAPTDPKALKISKCQTIVNPAKYTGKEAILNMIDLIEIEAKKFCYQDVAHVIIESPPKIFNSKVPSSVVSNIAHITGACIVAFGSEKAHIFHPIEWNKRRKKEQTHADAIKILGDPNMWDYERKVKSEKLMEHIFDAASMGLWWLKSNYIEENE